MLQPSPPPLASLRATFIAQHPRFNSRLMLEFYVVAPRTRGSDRRTILLCFPRFPRPRQNRLLKICSRGLSADSRFALTRAEIIERKLNLRLCSRHTQVE